MVRTQARELAMKLPGVTSRPSNSYALRSIYQRLLLCLHMLRVHRYISLSIYSALSLSLSILVCSRRVKNKTKNKTKIIYETCLDNPLTKHIHTLSLYTYVVDRTRKRVERNRKSDGPSHTILEERIRRSGWGGKGRERERERECVCGRTHETEGIFPVCMFM